MELVSSFGVWLAACPPPGSGTQAGGSVLEPGSVADGTREPLDDGAGRRSIADIMDVANEDD